MFDAPEPIAVAAEELASLADARDASGHPLLDGAFSASGTVGLAPLYGGKFPDPAAFGKNPAAQSIVKTLLRSAHTGVELAGAQVSHVLTPH